MLLVNCNNCNRPSLSHILLLLILHHRVALLIKQIGGSLQSNLFLRKGWPCAVRECKTDGEDVRCSSWIKKSSVQLGHMLKKEPVLYVRSILDVNKKWVLNHYRSEFIPSFQVSLAFKLHHYYSNNISTASTLTRKIPSSSACLSMLKKHSRLV